MTRPFMLHRLQRRARLQAEDGAALLMVIMLMMVTSTLSILVLGLVLAQVKPSQYADKNSRTVFAAEAGIEAALGEIRSSLKPPDHSGAVYGDRTKLPCTVVGPVGGGSDNLAYSVSIAYYKDDPAGRSASWLTANKLACNTGHGTLLEPSFAVLQSSGTADGVKGLASTAGNRSIRTIYAFQVTNVNVAGGIMFTIDDSACLRAESAVAGSKVRYTTTCNGGDDLALWVYDTDYGIKLASSMSSTATELCVTGPFTNPFSGTVDAQLQQCTAAWNQLWSYEGGAKFRGQKADKTGYSSVCLWAGAKVNNVNNRVLQVGVDGCSSSNHVWGSFAPEPTVGAGAAGYTTNQIVNYLEFGRCYDVTNQQVSYSYMIIYPCKQDPSGGAQLCWNHRWYYVEGTTSPQRVSVNYPSGGGCGSTAASTAYCLQTPTLTASTPRHVRVVTCSTSDVRQQWVRYGFTGDYTTSYTFVDTYGRCAAVGPKGSNHPQFSTIVVATCSGGPEQKWNAPPGADPAAVKDYRETTSG